ncbi:unnamed protein product [Mytilus coruscus]|uniref:Integrase catalytic domain-containing protein n=1 Tax=Mytilus coruscus TaxID=42192 RepID=A0A6J8BUT8_MYTCO|nr:unnamed protein product [Mytilus coruscus]
MEQQKGKINTFDANESENDENNNGVAVDPLQVQLQENQQVMKQVVEGLDSRKPCDIQNELHQTCGKIHHKNLHTAHIDGISFHNSTQVINDDKNKNGVLLMISSVQCKDMSLTTLWDPGANMSITHKTETIRIIWTRYNIICDEARSRLGSTEKRLLNSLEYASAYDEQIMDMVKRGIARKLTKEEMEIHSGPVHYIPHHEVLKPESKSTPLRIVFNSSSSYMEHTLNDYWAQGSNVINDLLAVLIRFRQESIALVGDISKMYNAIRLSSLDQHTQICVEKFRNTQRSRSLCIVNSYFWRQTEGAFRHLHYIKQQNVSTHLPRCIKDGDKKQWGTAHGGFESRLVIAKNRIAPTKQMSVPRLELCGAVLAARIRQKLVEEMDYKFSRVIHIVDSMIVRAQIQRESYGFAHLLLQGYQRLNRPIGVDLFGPLTIKDTVKGRTHGKAYGVLFNCMSSRAVYVDLADGYGTSSFIMVLRRFTSVRGYPKKIRSDLGSQLVSASKELKEVIQNWHWDTIKMFGNGNGMEWEF